MNRPTREDVSELLSRVPRPSRPRRPRLPPINKAFWRLVLTFVFVSLVAMLALAGVITGIIGVSFAVYKMSILFVGLYALMFSTSSIVLLAVYLWATS